MILKNGQNSAESSPRDEPVRELATPLPTAAKVPPVDALPGLSVAAWIDDFGRIANANGAVEVGGDAGTGGYA